VNQRAFVSDGHEQGVKLLVQKWSSTTSRSQDTREAKQAFAIPDEALLYVPNEKGHPVHLTERGVEFLAPNDQRRSCFPISRWRSAASRRIPHDAREKLLARQKIETEYALRA